MSGLGLVPTPSQRILRPSKAWLLLLHFGLRRGEGEAKTNLSHFPSASTGMWLPEMCC